MEGHGLSCQVCVVRLNTVFAFKKHLHSKQHYQKMREVFQKDAFRTGGSIPFIIVLNPLAKPEMKQPIIGLSMLSLCFSLGTKPFFYLCHICEEKCGPSRILHHLSSGDHCSNYFNYTNPNVLSFSWMPSMEMRDVLRPQLIQEVSARGSGTLQMLELPQNLIKKLETSTYSEVMDTLNENEKFCKLFEATKSERKMIQTYQRDKNRKHPLLGMQHLIECSCVGPPEKRYYLCTLCKLTLTKHMIIKHVLSFDHIYCYFKVWHPSTLLSKECYREYNISFASMMQNLAKQTEEIHGTANTDMKEVNLNPAEFLSVDCKSYSEALKRLECIMEEKKQGTLIPSIKPGNKLEYHPEVTNPLAAPYKVRCQDCSFVFDKIFQYKRHLTDWKHKQMLTKFCRDDESANGCHQTEPHMPHLGLYRCISDGLKRNQPVVGASLIVTCVSTQGPTNNIYICFACKDCFPEETIKQHLHSEKHLIHTLLYQNPWCLPFAWENQVDVDFLKSMAWKEERERGLNQRLMKILDLPFLMMHSLDPLSYPKVMKRLQLYHTLLKNEVPHCETYSKLKENERFPLLGRQFLVMHDTLRRHDAAEVEGFLCLLCERRLSDAECYAHEFSREHVAKFLDRFHPGSQTLNADTETLLDLATQAARIHSISHVQKIELDIPIREPCHYYTAINILASAKRRTGGGSLEPQITPKMKLTPKKTMGNVDKDHMTDNSQQCTTKKGSKDQSGQKTTGNDKTTPEKISGGLDSEIAKKCSHSQTSTDEMKPAGGERCHLIKEEEEEIEVSLSRSPTGEIPDSILKVEKDDEAEVGKDGKTMYNCIPTHANSYPCKGNERKRAHSTSEKSQDDKGSDEKTGIEMGCKRRRCTSKQDASPEQSQKVPSDELKGVTTTDTGGSGISIHKTIKDEERLTWQDSGYGLPATSAMPGVKLEHSSVTVDAQHEVSSMVAQKTPRCTATTTKSSETDSKCTASTRKSALVSKPQECKTGAVSKVTAISCKAAPTGSSTVVQEVTSRTASSETASKITVTSETTVTILANDVAKGTVQHKNTQASKVVPRSHTSNPPAAPHQIMVRPEHKSPSTEPSHIYTAKMKPSEKPPKVGINHLITVTCGGKQKIYCKLCSVKLKASNHLYDALHKYNYVKEMRPKSCVRLGEESKLNSLVDLLLQVEKTEGCSKGETIEVTSDEYIALGAVSDEEGLKRVKQMLEERNMRNVQSPCTTAQTFRHEFSSPNDEMYMQQNEMSGFSTKNHPNQLQRQESMDSFAQIPNPCQEAPEDRQQQERYDPRTQGTDKTPPVIPPSPTPFSSAAVVNTELQRQSRCSLEAEHISNRLRCSGRPEQNKASEAHLKISVGEKVQGSSNLSKYLNVKNLETIGLGYVWECQGPSQTSFYLCESCREKLSIKDIFQHLTSTDHIFKYIGREYPQHLNFWQDNVSQKGKEDILKGVAQKLYQRESDNGMDAQAVALGKDLYEYVRTAPFSEALEMVRNISKVDKLSVLCPSASTLQQTDKPSEEQWESQEEPLPTEEPDTDQTSENEARHKTDERDLKEETAMAGHLDEVKHGTVRSPLHVTGASSNADSVVLPFFGSDTDLRPRKTCRSPSIQPQPGPPDTEHQEPVGEMQVEQAEMHKEPQSTVSPKTVQTLSVSPTDKSLAPQKRPAETSVEALRRTELQEHLPTKCTHTSQQQDGEPSSEPDCKSTSVNPNATSTTLPQEDKRSGPEPYAEEDCAQLVDLLVQMREDRSGIKAFLCKPDPDNATTESGVESTLDSKCELGQAIAKSDGTALSSASTADSSEPETQSVSTETISGSVTLLKPDLTDCDVTNHNAGQISQPQGNTQTETSGVDFLPINTIITAGSNRSSQQMGGSKEQKHTQGHDGNQAAHSATPDTSIPSNTQTHLTGYFQYSQMAPVTNGNSHHLSTTAAAGYSSPVTPLVPSAWVNLAAQPQLQQQQQQQQWQYQQQQVWQQHQQQVWQQQQQQVWQQQQQQVWQQQQQQVWQQQQQLHLHSQQQLQLHQQQQLQHNQQQQLYQYQQLQMWQYLQQQQQQQPQQQ